MTRSLLSLSLSVLLLAAACGRDEKAGISADLKERGTTDLMKQVAEDSYTAPEDGKLTEAQVQMYLKVREKEKAIAQVAKAEAVKHAEDAKKNEKSLAGMMDSFKTMGSVADLMTADIRAAKDLGYNSQEYLWVKGQILEASGAAMGEKMAEAMSANFDTAYVQAKKAHDEATDENTRKMYAEVLAGYDKSRAEMKQNQSEVSPSVAHNRQILAKYGTELNAYAHEMAKYEDKPGESVKAADEWQKQLDEAKNKKQ
jgi:hypothetical protein